MAVIKGDLYMKKFKLIALIIGITLIVGCGIACLILFSDEIFLPEETTIENIPTYTVIFYDDNNTILKIDTVSENSSAVPPKEPIMTHGMIFQSWDTDFSNVTSNLEVRPICQSVKGVDNVIALQSAYASTDGTVIIPLHLCGDVCISGLDISIWYDSNSLSLESVTADAAVILNDQTPGIIKLNYVSVTNTDADVDLCDLKFRILASEGSHPMSIEVNGITAFDPNADHSAPDLITPACHVINGTVFVLE